MFSRCLTERVLTRPPQQILLHTLNENGVGSPASLETYVHEDIDRYGVKLTDLHGKLKKARSDQLDGISKQDSSSRDTESCVLPPQSLLYRARH